MQDIRAIILNRSNRKFWYIRYFVTNIDGSVSKFEESTGVQKAEKTLVKAFQIQPDSEAIIKNLIYLYGNCLDDEVKTELYKMTLDDLKIGNK